MRIKSALGAAGLVFLVLGTVTWFRNRRSPDEASSGPATAAQTAPSSPTSKTGGAVKRQRKTARTLFSQGIDDAKVRAIPPEATPSQTSTVPENCAVRWRTIAVQSLSEFIAAIQEEQMAVDAQCSAIEQSLLPPFVSGTNLGDCFVRMGAAKVAAETEPEKAQDPEAKACQTAFTFLRAAVVDQLYPEQDPSALPSQVLANKILIGIQDAMESPEKRVKTLALVEELIKREPDLYAGHKAKAVLSLVEPGADGQPDPDNPKFVEALQACREFGVNDPELDEVAFIRHAISGHPEKLGDEARSILAANPQSALGQYFLASDEFRNGHREEAIRRLQLAQNLAPTDTRIKETLEKAKTAAPEDKIFSSRLSVSFDDGTL